MKVIICLSVILLYVGSGGAFPADISTTEIPEISSTAAAVIDDESTAISTSDSTTAEIAEDLSTAATSVDTSDDKKRVNESDNVFVTTDIIHDDGNDYKVSIISKTDTGKDGKSINIGGLPFKVRSATTNFTIHPIHDNGTDIAENDTTKDITGVVNSLNLVLELNDDDENDLTTEPSSSLESEEPSESCSDDNQECQNSRTESSDEVHQNIPIDVHHNKKKPNRNEGNEENNNKDIFIFPKPYFPPPLPPARNLFFPFLIFPFQYYPYPTHPFEWRERR